MNEDKYLMTWTLKAIAACRAEGTRPETLLSETLWANLGAPHWVLPAMKEAYARAGLALTNGDRDHGC